MLESSSSSSLKKYLNKMLRLEDYTNLMEGHEMNKFVKVCLIIILSLCYCYFIGKIVSKGTKRLIFIFPIIPLFLILPLNLTSINCGGNTAFFISWLANFKLLLFAFGKGPLVQNPPKSNSLGRFIAYACFPIEIQNDQNTLNSDDKNNKHNNNNPSLKKPKQGQKNWVFVIYAIKGLILAILVSSVFEYKKYMHPKVILFLYTLYIYLILDLILATTTALARAANGVELEPHFDEPYLSSSLQDFWGRRWNLMVSRVLRPTIYKPTLGFWARIIGPKWASIPAIMATFIVSGLMHELIFFYWCRVRPTWEPMLFFVLHGTCLAVEIVLKKLVGTTTNDTWRLPRWISGPLTVGFVMESCFRLMFPHVLRCKTDLRLFGEYDAIRDFFKSKITLFSH
ncbi:acyl-CoA--sterol O-acyltransferase 1-like [Cannabis sativa]|uniref:acyl-CoA--sterol O-acyltransferase 1-like n=1 Tax=Cannabis sativa TaxID=3483 RepID=UPI0029CA33A1|nr:acyl-CoA--sterol O-acyltransferase 1-like [Cannabis sativa]